MTTRDPRSRASVPASQAREPTQSLQIDPDDALLEDDELDDPSHPSLALGTHGTQGGRADGGDERTRIESPGGRVKTPAPQRAATRPPPVPSADDPDGRIGTTLGSYKVAELLGKGGMGYVYRAEHVKLGREVALKLLRTDYAKRKDAVARFIQEARTVNRIRHRNIVDVPDILELEDGTTCIVMEYLRGTSLGKWARTGIDLPRALAVLVQICDGLAAAHSVSIVHRDLKPDNVFIIPTSDGAELVKLLDFGVAKLINQGDEDIGFQTAAGSVIGTPAYMSPEQAGGMAVDARSDIYSLGAIMYELFTGQPMFRGRSFGEYVRKHLTEQPLRPRNTQGGAGMDERLEGVILHALEKDPGQRFQNIIELRDALLHLLGGLETMPPNFANMTGSGVRPQPTPMPYPQAQMPTVLPTMLPTMVPPSVQHHTGSGPHVTQMPMQHSAQWSNGYASYNHVVGVPPQPAQTPWWVWFLGGAVAVGLGVGAAVFYAGGSDDVPPAPAVQQPVAQVLEAPVAPVVSPPIEPTVAPPTVAANIELRFDSLPSASVYRAGEAAEICRTPCVVSEKPEPRLRAYVVKADGYQDGMVEVDLATTKRDFKLDLERVVTDDPKLKGGKTGKKSLRPKLKDEPVKADPTPVVTPPVVSDPPPEKKPTKKTGDKIDRSDTLDPFRSKTP